MMNTRVRMVFRKALSIACALLVLPAGALLVAQQPPPQYEQEPPQQGPPDQSGPTGQALSPDQLANLVAPVALYPDSLLSQVLVASTYPLEIAEAAQWLQQNRNLRGQELVEAARQQNWDASVQALVVFPDVVNRLNSNIRWTTDLGNAFLAQQADVMNAVQSMRAQAREDGKLNSNRQETVTTQTQGGQSVIEIQPANPQVVYVPAYNPEYIWGPPAYGYYPPLYYPEVGFGFGFGSGIYIGGFFGGLGWGGWGWGPSWFGHSIYVNNNFFTHYGYNGYRGGSSFQGRGGWSHNPVHRQGVPYSNSALSNRYYGNSSGRGGMGGGRNGGQGYAGSRQQSSNPMNSGNYGNRGYQGTNTGAPRSYSQPGGAQYQQGGSQRGNFSRGAANNGGSQRGSLPQSNSAQGWQRSRGQGPGTSQPAVSSGRGGWSTTSSSGPSSPAYSTNGGYRSSPSYSGTAGSYGGGRATPSYRNSSPAYSTNGGYRSSPSYSGTAGSYGGGRTAPSYRNSSPAYSGGGGSRGGGGSVSSSRPSGGSRSGGGSSSSRSSGARNDGGRRR